MKYLPSIFIFFSFFFLFPAVVYGVECGATPTDSCTISQSTTFTPGTYNLPGGISIIAEDVTLDCSGAVLDGISVSNKVAGITIQSTGTRGHTIQNCNITHYWDAITTKTNISDSTIINNNFIANKRVLYFVDNSDNGYTSPKNNIIDNNNFIDNTDTAIGLYRGDQSFADNNIISNNKILGIAVSTPRGIVLDGGRHNVIDRNALIRVGEGIEVSGGGSGYADYNNITNNALINNSQGIKLNGANYAYVEFNNIEFPNQIGINLLSSSYSILHDNHIVGALQQGIKVGMSQGQPTSNNNIFYHNNFLANVKSALDYGSNYWNNTVDGGNFWLEFNEVGEGCVDNNVNGICDAGYNVNLGIASNTPSQATGIDHSPFTLMLNTGLFSNFAPFFEPPVQDIVVNEGDSAILTITAYGLGPLTYSFTNPSFFATTQPHVFIWQTNFTDAENYGSHIETVRVKDAYNVSVTQDILVTVNDVANTECSNGVKNSCTVSASTTLPANQVYNFRDGIRVTGNNFVLNCQGSTFDGAGFSYVSDGITMNSATGVTLQNCKVRNYDEGIKILSSSNNIFSNFQTSATRIGMFLHSSHANQILGSSINSSVQNGVQIIQSHNNTFDGGTITTVAQKSGMYVESSQDNNIKNIIVSGVPNENGIRVNSSTRTLVEGNILKLSANGLRLESSSQSTIRKNTFTENSARGVLIISGANNNNLYNNNFINNPTQAQDSGSSNMWSLNNEGNYWSDYSAPAQGCLDTNFNGMCDAPKTFNYNQDAFPFTNINGWNNMWPIITSTPVITALNNTLYVYDVDVIDPDNDPLTFRLAKGPRGMTLNTSSGLITWMAYKPRNMNSTLVPVSVRVSDPYGGSNSQSWQILVTSS